MTRFLRAAPLRTTTCTLFICFISFHYERNEICARRVWKHHPSSLDRRHYLNLIFFSLFFSFSFVFVLARYVAYHYGLGVERDFARATRHLAVSYASERWRKKAVRKRCPKLIKFFCVFRRHASTRLMHRFLRSLTTR